MTLRKKRLWRLMEKAKPNRNMCKLRNQARIWTDTWWTNSISRLRNQRMHPLKRSIFQYTGPLQNVLHFQHQKIAYYGSQRSNTAITSLPEDSHFANYRFSFRFVPFRFAPFRFANYSKPQNIRWHGKNKTALVHLRSATKSLFI